MPSALPWAVRTAVPRADAALALALATLWQLEIWASEVVPGVAPLRSGEVVLAVIGPLATLPLAVRRRLPVTSAASVLAGIALAHLLATPQEGLAQLAAMFIATYSVAAHGGRWAAAAGIALALAAAAVTVKADPDDFVFTAVLLGASWLAGRAIRLGRERAATLEALNRQLDAEREANARLAVELERSRMARELHDVVAHAVSVMVVQAAGVRGLLPPERQDERAALAAVEATGREAMSELRRMLGILRDAPDAAALAPPPRLQHIDRLVEQVRGAGLSVQLSVDGAPRPLAPGLELTGYRVVQEALTNALKHAREANVAVTIRYGPRELEIDVCDDGAATWNGGGAGHGLAGMRERVALFGGRLEAGRQERGGFRVRARFPTDSRA